MVNIYTKKLFFITKNLKSRIILVQPKTSSNVAGPPEQVLRGNKLFFLVDFLA